MRGGRVLVAALVAGALLVDVGSAVGASTTAARPSSGCKQRSSPPSVEVTKSIAVDGVTRSYRIVGPKRAGDRPLPLVLLVHGFSSNAQAFSSLTRLPQQGARDGFLVATPDGIDGRWQLDPHGTDADFLDALVDQLTSAYCVDVDRIHAAGMSLGSAFATSYSCARQDRIASIALVTVEFQLGCDTPMSIVAFHGTADPLVPYTDGAIGLSLPGPVRGTELNMGDWATLGGCDASPRVRRIGAEVVRRTWPGCRAGHDVVLYTVEGGGHTWPGADPALSVTPTTDEVDATAAALRFFARHSQ